eukprot:Hpha_TRINITY_DN18496_c0_g1::TRINITY_DN18496_c0_g1_i1::g.165339::m.165339
MELFDPMAADEVRRRRCKFHIDELNRELWEGVERDAPPDVLSYAANLVERRRGLEARGTLLIVAGKPGVGTHSVLSGARDMLRKNENVRFCSTVCDAQTDKQRRASRMDRRVPNSQLAAARRRGEFLSSFRDRCGALWAIPLEVSTFLADSGKRGGRTVVLRGPPEAYTAAVEVLPGVDTGVIRVTCDPFQVKLRRDRARGGAAGLLGAIAARSPQSPPGGRAPPTSPLKIGPPAQQRPSSPLKVGWGGGMDGHLGSSPQLTPGSEDRKRRKEGGGAGAGFCGVDTFSDAAEDDEDDDLNDWSGVPDEVIVSVNNSGPLGDAVGELIGVIEEPSGTPQMPIDAAEDSPLGVLSSPPAVTAAGGGRAAALLNSK